MAYGSAAPKLVTSAVSSVRLHLVHSAGPRNPAAGPSGAARLALVTAEPARPAAAAKPRLYARAVALVHHLLPHMPAL